MAFPIGYWVSAKPEHPAHPILSELEQRFGSYFQALAKSEIECILSACAWVSPKLNGAWNLLAQRALTDFEQQAIQLVQMLPDESRYALIPFLYEQIRVRGDK
jgi:hypothetical protein